MKLIRLLLWLIVASGGRSSATAAPSVARLWDEQILAAIRIDLPNPPVHARNLFHLSAAMYDAWAAYDSVAVGYLYRGKFLTNNTAAAQDEAVSYAAYRLLKERYALSRNATNTLAALDAQMAALGYDRSLTHRDTSTPAGVGNSVAATVSAFFLNDGANQAQAYADWPVGQGGYVPVNPPLDTTASGTVTVDVNHWQPLSIATSVTQNGLPVASIQKFIGATWLGVRPFALSRDDVTLPWIDPGPPPYLNGLGDVQFRNEVVEVIRRSSQLTPDDGVTLDISPGALGNNSLGTNDGTGHSINPVTGQPYATNIVKRGDFARVLAEFWADGPSSETPPGHWNVLANSVSDTPAFAKRLGGTGSVLADLEWDVKLYFALNAAVHEAACAAWSLKHYYDGGRPIAAIRYMGQLGQSSDTDSLSYHTNGLPLVPGLIEVVTVQTSQTGQRHAGLPVGNIAIYAWPGQPAFPLTQYSGARWMNAVDWLPYQKKTFITPAFPGYVSGHSTFSRSAAEILAAITGTPFFPGGLGGYTVNTLSFESGPTQPVNLQWATYFDAADQAGLSRLWGGIHVSVDDLTGRKIGAQCGQGVWALAQKYFDGSVTNVPVTMSLQTANAGTGVVRCNTLRGFYYQLQSTADLQQPFVDDGGGFTQALDAAMTRTNQLTGNKFYRVLSTPVP